MGSLPQPFEIISEEYPDFSLSLVAKALVDSKHEVLDLCSSNESQIPGPLRRGRVVQKNSDVKQEQGAQTTRPFRKTKGYLELLN
jgi:hypothetical protein